MRVYKDGNVAEATRDQLEAMLAGGWSRTPVKIPIAKPIKKEESSDDLEKPKRVLKKERE